MTLGTSKSACVLVAVLWAATLSHAQQALPGGADAADGNDHWERCSIAPAARFLTRLLSCKGPRTRIAPS